MSLATENSIGGGRGRRLCQGGGRCTELANHWDHSLVHQKIKRQRGRSVLCPPVRARAHTHTHTGIGKVLAVFVSNMAQPRAPVSRAVRRHVQHVTLQGRLSSTAKTPFSGIDTYGEA